jgi:hypothetical protein
MNFKLLKNFTVFTLYLFLLLLAFLFVKDYLLKQVADHDYDQKVVYKDHTAIKIDTVGGKIEKVNLLKEKVNARTLKALADIEEFKTFEKNGFDRDLKDLLDRTFAYPYSNISTYADWFYAYPTQYKILYKGAEGIADKYRGSLGEYSLTDAATHAIAGYITKHYKDMVIKPHLLQPKFEREFKQLMLKYIERKEQFMRALDASFSAYIDKIKAEFAHIGAEDIDIDWISNAANMKNLLSLKNKDGTSGALILGGMSAISAKIAAGAASKAVAGKIIAKVGLKKLIASTAAKASAGVATFGVGAILGGAIDYSLNKGDELAHRDEFEADVKEGIDNIIGEIYYEIQGQEVIERLYDQDENMYKKFLNEN